MRPVKIYKLAAIALLFLVSCSSCKENKSAQEGTRLTQEESIQLNKGILAKEKEEIDLFIKRYEWDMETSGTGLRYDIYYSSGSTDRPVKGDEITLKYTVKGLDGNLIYDSDVDGLMYVKVEQDRTPRGIREGVQLLGFGDKARFILPSHLAYGVHGDENKISHSQVLVYDMELISIAK